LTRIALAHPRFQAGAVEHLDAAARVADQVGLLQLQRPFGHAFPAHAEHVGDQLLGHRELVARQPVQAEQQPAAELLVERVMAVADSRLRHLRDECLGVAQHEVQHRCPLELVLHGCRRQPEAFARTLHDSAARRRLAAHEERDADDAFVAHDGDLGRRTVLENESSEMIAVVGKQTWLSVPPDS